LRTAENSRIALRWSDQSILRFGALTELEILPSKSPHTLLACACARATSLPPAFSWVNAKAIVDVAGEPGHMDIAFAWGDEFQRGRANTSGATSSQNMPLRWSFSDGISKIQ
jgi:hypothetical protein